MRGVLDDVVVGDDVAVGRDDGARAAALLDPVALGLVGPEGEPEHAEGRLRLRLMHLDLNGDDRRGHARGDVLEGLTDAVASAVAAVGGGCEACASLGGAVFAIVGGAAWASPESMWVVAMTAPDTSTVAIRSRLARRR